MQVTFRTVRSAFEVRTLRRDRGAQSALRHNPGSRFRAFPVNTFWRERPSLQVLRDLKDKNSIQSFIGSASAAYGSTGSSFDSNFSRFSTGPIPSWEFYSEAAEEAVPIYKVELAKSGRSKVSAVDCVRPCFSALLKACLQLRAQKW